MHINYPSYQVGGVREVVTRAMFKYLNDVTVLFSEKPWIYCRWKEKYQTGDWKGYRIILGARSSSASGGLVRLPRL